MIQVPYRSTSTKPLIGRATCTETTYEDSSRFSTSATGFCCCVAMPWCTFQLIFDCLVANPTGTDGIAKWRISPADLWEVGSTSTTTKLRSWDCNSLINSKNGAETDRRICLLTSEYLVIMLFDTRVVALALLANSATLTSAQTRSVSRRCRPYPTL